MANHTPGPWTRWEGHAVVFAGVQHNDCFGVSGRNLMEIARCESDDLGEDDDEGEEIAEANARLIAAAPDLLAALHKLEWSALHPRYGHYCPACESLQSEGEHEPNCYLGAAVAKAQGDINDA